MIKETSITNHYCDVSISKEYLQKQLSNFCKLNRDLLLKHIQIYKYIIVYYIYMILYMLL